MLLLCLPLIYGARLRCCARVMLVLREQAGMWSAEEEHGFVPVWYCAQMLLFVLPLQALDSYTSVPKNPPTRRQEVKLISCPSSQSHLLVSTFRRRTTVAECRFFLGFLFSVSSLFVLLPLLHYENRVCATVLLLPAMIGGRGSSSGRWLIAPRDGKCTVHTDDMGQLLSRQHCPPSKDPVFVFLLTKRRKTRIIVCLFVCLYCEPPFLLNTFTLLFLFG